MGVIRFIVLSMVISFGFASVAYAAVYRSYDKDGNVIYSDKPTKGSEPVKLPKGNTYTAPPSQTINPGGQGQGDQNQLLQNQLRELQKNLTPQQQQPGQQPQQGIQPYQPQQPTKSVVPPGQYYKGFNITSPTDQQSFHNQPQIPVTLAVSPGLRPGDKMRVLVDGNPATTAGTSTSFNLQILDRGTHSLQGQVLDSAGVVVLTSPAITIYVHRNAISTGTSQ